MRWVVSLGLAGALACCVWPEGASAENSWFAGGGSSSAPYHKKHVEDELVFHPRHRDAVSCFSAVRGLWRQGYRSIEARDCWGSQYRFSATSNLSRYRVDVSGRTGKIIFITPE